MKYLLFLISFGSLNCFAQSDSSEIKFRHRLWINPTQIATGQYTVAYGWRIHGGKDWFEVAAGYRYFPISFDSYYTGGGTLATPSLGILFYGPIISLAYDQYYVKVKKRMQRAAEKDSSIQKIIDHLKPLNSIRYELQYQYLQHKPACYYRGEEDYAYTYSSTKSAITGKALWSRISSRHQHIAAQTYAGLGFQLGFGKKTLYSDTAFHPGPRYYDLCVRDINASSVITSAKNFGYFIPWLYLGVRLGFQ